MTQALAVGTRYRDTLTEDEALAEIRAGRGTQFAPVVVDAFFFAAALLPDELGLGEPLQRAV